MILEWTNPLWLWTLLPLALLAWWLKNQRPLPYSQQKVASIQLWKRLTPATKRSQHWSRWIPALLLVTLASGPRFLAPPIPDHAWTRSLSGDLRLDFIHSQKVDAVFITAEDGSETDVDFVSEQSFHSAWLPDVGDGKEVRIRSGRTQKSFETPPRLTPPRIFYQGSSIAMKNLLDALELEGWIFQVRSVDSSSPDIVIGPLGSNPRPHIALATKGNPVWLPSLQLPQPDEPLFEGLDPISWTVTTGFSIQGGTPLLTTASGQTLLARTPEGYTWGFEPDSGDLGDRSDWPLVMTRMLVDLTTRPPENHGWAWAGIHLSLIVSLGLMAVLLFSGKRGSLPCVLAILAAILAGTGLKERSWKTPTSATTALEQLKSIPSGTRLLLPAESPAPSPDLALAIHRRGLSWIQKQPDSAPSKTSQWQLSRSLIDPGEMIEIVGDRPAGNWFLTSPQGSTEIAQGPIRKQTPGVWKVTDPNGRELTFHIRSPIQIAISATPGSGLPNLFSDPRFESQQLLEKGLPSPASGSVIAWRGEALPEEILEEIPNWISAGGTLLAISGDSICKDEPTRRSLEKILGAPLPSEEGRDLDMGVILLDLSGSLIGDSATTLLESTLAVIDTPSTGLRWGIAGFRNDFEWLLDPGTLVDSETTRLLASKIRSGGGTHLGRALSGILPQLDLHQGSKRLLILTDGRTVPADWSSIGNRLALAGIELEILLLGETVETSAAEELVQAAKGTLQSAKDFREAIPILSKWIPTDFPGWVRTRAPLIQNEISPLASGFSADLPVPDHWFNPGLKTPPEFTATVAWTDSSGMPLLSSLTRDRGQGILWWSSLDPLKLGESTAPIYNRLRNLIATSAGRTSPTERKSAITRGPEGKNVLLLERKLSESLILQEIQIQGTGQQPEYIQLSALPGSQYYTANLQGTPKVLMWKEGEQIGHAKEVFWKDLQTQSWLRIQSDQTTSTGGQPLAILLTIAAFLWISNPGNRE